MKILERPYANEEFTSLKEAKQFYGTLEQCNKDDFLGTEEEYNEYIQTEKEYKAALNSAESLEEFADIWNEHTDRFEDGSRMTVREVEEV